MFSTSWHLPVPRSHLGGTGICPVVKGSASCIIWQLHFHALKGVTLRFDRIQVITIVDDSRHEESVEWTLGTRAARKSGNVTEHRWSISGKHPCLPCRCVCFLRTLINKLIKSGGHCSMPHPRCGPFRAPQQVVARQAKTSHDKVNLNSLS